VGPEAAASVGPKAAVALGGRVVVTEEVEAPVWRLGQWRSQGVGVEESGVGVAGPQPAMGTVVEESGLIDGGRHIDLDD
jgi:hypothetical protein